VLFVISLFDVMCTMCVGSNPETRKRFNGGEFSVH